MSPQLLHFGNSQTPVVVVDDMCGAALTDAVRAAVAMAPFPESNSPYYPGLRRIIGEEDDVAFGYVRQMLEEAAPYIGGGFDADGFDLLEASFSMVTRKPDELVPAQRSPHFDSTNPRYLAVMHYLSDTPETGTAFYRQRATGIETMTDTNIRQFIETAQIESARVSGYINGSDAYFEQIGAVEAKPDRLVIYPGCLLHSGIIPADMNFSSDPREGRLTTNIFVMAR